MSIFLQNLTPHVRSLVRIVAAYLFVLHGTAKHLGIPFIEGMSGISSMSLPGIAGWLELVGGTLLLFGLFTRPVAFVLSGQMAFAYFIAHAPRTPLLPLMNGGESAVLFCFLFLYFSVAGAGPWSLDALRARGRASR
jgi:putative oxidoreductase